MSGRDTAQQFNYIIFAICHTHNGPIIVEHLTTYILYMICTPELSARFRLKERLPVGYINLTALTEHYSSHPAPIG